MSIRRALCLIALSLFSVLTSPVTIEGGPSHVLSLTASQPTQPLFANLSSPVPGQVLYPGKPFRIKFANGATAATTTQVSLFNETGLFVVGANLPFHHYITDIRVLLPIWVGPGTYDLVFSENDGQGGTSFNDVVSFTIYVRHRPPGGIGGGANAHMDIAEDSTEREPTGLSRRAPHPAKFLNPTNLQNFTAGSTVNINFTDGETTADTVSFILQKDSGELLYQFGKFPFVNYRAGAKVALPKKLPTGSYKLVAQENSSWDKKMYSDGASVTIQVVPQSHQKRGIREWAEQLKAGEQDGANRKRPQIPLLRMSESPSFLLPKVAEDVPLGSTFECKIYDPIATSELVKFVLKGADGREHYLGQAKYSKHIAGGSFKSPSDILLDSYRLVAKQNSVARPNRFLDVVSTDVIVSSETQILNQSITEDSKSDEFVNCDEKMDQSRVKDVEATSHTVSLSTSIHNEIVTPGSKFECKLTDKRDRHGKVRFLIRDSRSGMQLVVGRAEYSEKVGKTSCHIPHDVPLASYDFIAQERHDGSFVDVESTQLTVQTLSKNNRSDKKSVASRIERREPHFPKIVEPIRNQTISVGSSFSCSLLDAQPGPVARFLIRAEGSETEHIVGRAHFGDSYWANATCRMPDDVLEGYYRFVAQENSPSVSQKYIDILHGNVVHVHITAANPHPPVVRRTTLRIAKPASLLTREVVRLSAREPHPATLISPTASQNLTPGDPFDCLLRDGETSATLVKFLLRDSLGNDTQVGETSFSNFQAQATFQCPLNLKPGAYVFAVQENTSADPDAFNDTVSVTVNVVAKYSSISSTPAISPTTTASISATPTSISISSMNDHPTQSETSTQSMETTTGIAATFTSSGDPTTRTSTAANIFASPTSGADQPFGPRLPWAITISLLTYSICFGNVFLSTC